MLSDTGTRTREAAQVLSPLREEAVSKEEPPSPFTPEIIQAAKLIQQIEDGPDIAGPLKFCPHCEPQTPVLVSDPLIDELHQLIKQLRQALELSVRETHDDLRWLWEHDTSMTFEECTSPGCEEARAALSATRTLYRRLATDFDARSHPARNSGGLTGEVDPI